MFKYILAVVTLVLSWQTHAIAVVTSIKPIQMITYALTDGVTQPLALLPSNASPHDYALKPSDVKTLRNADLVIWFGPELEPFMAKLVTDKNDVLTLSQTPGLPLRKYGATEHHHGHDHGTYDPHFWLGIDAVKQVAKAITAKLIKIDAVHASEYQANLDRFLAQLQHTDQRIKQQLASVRNNGYFVFHDAYGYFEEHFGLKNLGYFTVSPERKPGAKTLIQIRKTLAVHANTCVFAEPQFTPAVIDSVTRGTDAKIGRLDPMGMDIPLGKDSYLAFLRNMGNDLYNCLSAQNKTIQQ